MQLELELTAELTIPPEPTPLTELNIKAYNRNVIIIKTS